ncbi:hypothetical protein [Cohnella sp. CFH 77786]|nr:hypothetical protein [Cohnella sp. CFH 77786]
MTGRNNKPDNDGPASSPSRLDQFGDKWSENADRRPKKPRPAQNEGNC